MAADAAPPRHWSNAISTSMASSFETHRGACHHYASAIALVVGRASARPGGDAPQDEVSDPHGEERVFARLEP